MVGCIPGQGEGAIGMYDYYFSAATDYSDYSPTSVPLVGVDGTCESHGTDR